MTPVQAFYGTICKRLRNALSKLPNIGMVQEIREPQIGIHNIRVQREEILPHSTQPGVLIAKRRYKNRRLAIIIELEVNTSLRQYRPLIQLQRRAHLRLQAIFQQKPRLHTTPRHQNQELARARVDMGFIHAARIHEARRGRDAELDEGGESFAVCEIPLATGALAASGGWIGARVEVVLEPGVGGALLLQDGEAIDAVDCEFESVEEVLGYDWV